MDWSFIQTPEGRTVIQVVGVCIGLTLGAWLWSLGEHKR